MLSFFQASGVHKTSVAVRCSVERLALACKGTAPVKAAFLQTAAGDGNSLIEN